MCGLTGVVDASRSWTAESLQQVVWPMADCLAHRGPDDAGVWVDAEAGVALGHRRLAVIDLSAEGHQPMPSASGRYVMVFNGEVYNFRALRHELEGLGHTFRGHSDTEVMLAAIEQWQVRPALERFNGMFAFALWDRQERLLHLARDRLGEKPLYYGWVGHTFLFGSELKALRAYPDFRAEVDRDALALFLRLNYVPAPYCIYKGLYKLSPATVLTIDPRRPGHLPSPVPYWSLRATAEQGQAMPWEGGEQEAVARLEELLLEAVRVRMEADVPLGAFLSGGVDSSTVVALMQAQSARPVQTFTIGFHEDAYNEAEHARAVARHLGTQHTDLYVTPQEMMEVIPNLPTLYDEPFADSSQVPTFLVARMARRYVTVCLSGDGGDELFGGYIRYFLGRDIWKRVGWMPRALRRLAARGLTAVGPQTWEKAFQKVGALLPARARQRSPGDKLHKLAEVLEMDGPDSVYLRLVSLWKDPASVVLGAREPPTLLTDRRHWADLEDFTLRMMYLDAATYLPDDILVKVDRASMAVGLEARVPMLDHRVVEFAWRLPLRMKVRNGQGKWVLRQVLYKYVPRELIERPKMGFGVPIDQWLRGPLREWAESLLDEGRLRREGFFSPGPIREKWAEHQSGWRNWHFNLWGVLMFQAWLEEQRRVAAGERSARVSGAP